MKKLTAKALRALEDKVMYLIDPWIKTLGLGIWRIDLVYYDDPDEIQERFIKSDNETVVMRCWPNWPYLCAKIEVNLDAIRDMDDDELEAALVHELCHILVAEMHEADQHHEERVVTMLQKAFFWTRRQYQPEGD